MAFIVETGAVVAGANSLVDVTFADEFHLDRGNATWAALALADKQAALIVATDWLTQEFRGKWKGSEVKPPQPLDWPRRDVTRMTGMPLTRLNSSLPYYDPTVYYPANIVPDEVKKAVAVLALDVTAIKTTQTPVQAQASGGVGAVIKKKVGSLEIEYAEPNSDTKVREKPSFPAAVHLIAPLLRYTRGVGTITRA